jgi:hypothetical protein
MLPFFACKVSPRFNKLSGVQSFMHVIGGAGAPSWISSTKVDYCGPVNAPFVRRSTSESYGDTGVFPEAFGYEVQVDAMSSPAIS